MLAETRGIVPRIVSRIFECIAETEQPQVRRTKGEGREGEREKESFAGIQCEGIHVGSIR